MNPWFKLLAVLALFSAGVASGFGIEHNIATAKISTLDADNARYKATIAGESQRTQAAADKAASDKEHGWSQAFNDLASTAFSEKANAKLQSDAVIAGLRAGTMRMYVNAKVPACAAGSGDAGGSSAAGAGGSQTARVELSEQDGEFLNAYADDAEQLAIDYNRALGLLQAERASKSAPQSVVQSGG